MLVFEERGKPEYPEKNLSEQMREPTTNSTHIWHHCWDLNSGHIGGKRELSPLRYPFLPSFKEQMTQDALKLTLFFLIFNWIHSIEKINLNELN